MRSFMPAASHLAQQHWNQTPLFLSEDERYRIYPWLYEAAEFRRHAGHKVLEVGCGTGCDLLQFALHGARAFGIDITEEHLRLARERIAGRAGVQAGLWYEVRYGDGREIPFADGAFDYVYSHGVMHHSDEPEKFAAEILRVLKPGGAFNVHVYAKYSAFALKKFLWHGKNMALHIENSLEPVHIELYSAGMLQKIFGVPLIIEKYECRPFPKAWPRFEFMPSMLGWYLVAKGRKL